MAELIVNDANYREFRGDGFRVNAGGESRLLGSCLPRRTVYGECPGALPLADHMPLIPRSEWDARIAELDRTNGWLESITRGVIPCLDQDGLGYCHAYGTVLAAMVVRAKQGLPFVLLSPESIGGPITGWKNQGASPDDDLAQIRDHGACAESFMDKPLSLKHNQWKPGWEADCANHRIVEWWDLDSPGKIWDCCMTCTLLSLPYAAGFMWWGHLVCGGFKARKQSGRYQILYRNSWGPSYGDDGFFWMEAGKGTPDLGAFAPRVVTASEA